MIDPEEASKSYFDLGAEVDKKTNDCCDKASEDVKDALRTISFGSSKMKALLARLDREEREEKENT